MATDMEVEKDVTTQLEGEKEGMLSEAVETESKNLMESEELSRLKDTVEPANDVSNVNDVEMTAAEDTVVKDGGGDIPAAVEGLVGKDGCGDIPVVAAEDFACKDGCGDIPAAAAEDFGVKDGSRYIPSAAAEDSVIKDGCGDVPVTAEDSVVKVGCVNIPAATVTTVSTVVSNVEASGGDDMCGRTGEDDKKIHGLENLVVAVVASNDSLPEEKVKDEKDNELTNGMSGMNMSNEALVPGSGGENGSKEEELDNGKTQRDSLVPGSGGETGSKEEEINNGKTQRDSVMNDGVQMDLVTNTVSGLDVLQENGTKQDELSNKVTGMNMVVDKELKGEVQNSELDTRQEVCLNISNNSFLGPDPVLGDETGTEEERAEFMKELETFHKERFLEFKPPRFYGEPLNCLKLVLVQHLIFQVFWPLFYKFETDLLLLIRLWRSVIKLGGYEQVSHNFTPLVVFGS